MGVFQVVAAPVGAVMVASSACSGCAILAAERTGLRLREHRDGGVEVVDRGRGREPVHGAEHGIELREKRRHLRRDGRAERAVRVGLPQVPIEHGSPERGDLVRERPRRRHLQEGNDLTQVGDARIAQQVPERIGDGGHADLPQLVEREEGLLPDLRRAVCDLGARCCRERPGEHGGQRGRKGRNADADEGLGDRRARRPVDDASRRQKVRALEVEDRLARRLSEHAVLGERAIRQAVQGGLHLDDRADIDDGGAADGVGGHVGVRGDAVARHRSCEHAARRCVEAPGSRKVDGLLERDDGRAGVVSELSILGQRLHDGLAVEKASMPQDVDRVLGVGDVR